jgi:hypothetical protein
MLAELLLAGGLVAAVPADRRPLAIVAAGFVGVVWLCTVFVSVPIHGRLAAGLDNEQVAALVRTNWIRTITWTARAALLLGWMARG